MLDGSFLKLYVRLIVVSHCIDYIGIGRSHLHDERHLLVMDFLDPVVADRKK